MTKIVLTDIPSYEELRTLYLSSHNILAFDTDKYVSRLLKHPRISKNSRDAFKKWREHARHQNGKVFYDNMYADSPLPFSHIKDLEWQRIINHINVFAETANDMLINYLVVNDDRVYEVATIAGWIDYLKSLEIRPLFRRCRDKETREVLKYFLIDCGLIHDEHEQCIISFAKGSKASSKLWAAMLVLSKYHKTKENQKILTGSTEASDLLKSYLVHYNLPLIQLKRKEKTTDTFEKEFNILLAMNVKNAKFSRSTPT